MLTLGGYEFEELKGLEQMPQRAASAWHSIKGIVGTNFKPLLYCGKQIVKGTNHCFIAEETLQSIGQEKRIVAIVINEFNGKFEIVKDRFSVIFG